MVLPILTTVFAGAGFWLRKAQIQTAFEDTGLLQSGSGYTYALVALWLAAAAVCLGLGWLSGKGLAGSAKRGLMPEGYTPYFHLNTAAAGVSALGGALMALGGGLALSRSWRLLVTDKLAMIWGAVMLLVGLAAVYGAFHTSWDGTKRGLFAWELLAGCFGCCVWLVRIYQEHTANPCVMEYAPIFLGVICAGVGWLGMASFSFEKVRPILTLFACGMGVVLLGGTLADQLYYLTDPYRAAEAMTLPDELVVAGTMLHLFVQLCALSYHLENPKEIPTETPVKSAENGETETENHQDLL